MDNRNGKLGSNGSRKQTPLVFTLSDGSTLGIEGNYTYMIQIYGHIIKCNVLKYVVNRKLRFFMINLLDWSGFVHCILF